MKTLLTGTLIATLALSTAAMAFGPGMGNGRGYWNDNPQQLAQNTNPNAQKLWGRGRGQGNGQNNGMARGQGRGQGWRTNQNGTQATQQFQNRGNRTGEPVFVDGWDANEDRVVTPAEAKERRIDLFDALDENEDGKIVAAEFDQFLKDQKMAPEDATNGQHGLFSMSLAFNDADKNGEVTKDEFIAQTVAFLKGMDRDGDGKVTDADFGPRNGQMQRGQGRGNGRGQGRGWWQQQS